jgi:hypothetical protein
MSGSTVQSDLRCSLPGSVVERTTELLDRQAAARRGRQWQSGKSIGVASEHLTTACTRPPGILPYYCHPSPPRNTLLALEALRSGRSLMRHDAYARYPLSRSPPLGRPFLQGQGLTRPERHARRRPHQEARRGIPRSATGQYQRRSS